jgi:RNA polymerase sigma factor (sigma-70 family)
MGALRARGPVPHKVRDVRRGSRLPARLLRRSPDERLIAYVRGGSEAAFDVLFDRYYRGLLAFSVHMLGSVDEAEDVVQHAFLAAYRSIVTSDRRIQLRPWLYTVARNRCLTVLHARREHAGLMLDEPATEHLYAEVQRREDIRDLLGDLARLPEQQRAALLLAEAGAMPHADIAAVLGCPRAKVKALVFQARSSLAASRTARATPCREIREQIATLQDRALRQRTIRRHLPECPGCREFRDEVRRQRRALAITLPITSTLTVKEAVLAAIFGAGPAGAGGAAASAGSAVGLAAKALAVVALLGAGGAGIALRHEDTPATGTAAAPTERAAKAPADARRGPVAVAAAPVGDERSDRRRRAPDSRSVQSPKPAAALPDRATRRGRNAAPTEPVTEPQRGGDAERRDGGFEDRPMDATPRRRRQPTPVERDRTRALTVPSGAQPPQPVSQPVETDEESDTDDDHDGAPHGNMADEDDDAPHGNMADEDDDAPHGNMADEDDDGFVQPADD